MKQYMLHFIMTGNLIRYQMTPNLLLLFWVNKTRHKIRTQIMFRVLLLLPSTYVVNIRYELLLIIVVPWNS